MARDLLALSVRISRYVNRDSITEVLGPQLTSENRCCVGEFNLWKFRKGMRLIIFPYVYLTSSFLFVSFKITRVSLRVSPVALKWNLR